MSRRRRALFEAVCPWGSCRVRPSCADAGEIPVRSGAASGDPSCADAGEIPVRVGAAGALAELRSRRSDEAHNLVGHARHDGRERLATSLGRGQRVVTSFDRKDAATSGQFVDERG